MKCRIETIKIRITVKKRKMSWMLTSDRPRINLRLKIKKSLGFRCNKLMLISIDIPSL